MVKIGSQERFVYDNGRLAASGLVEVLRSVYKFSPDADWLKPALFALQAEIPGLDEGSKQFQVATLAVRYAEKEDFVFGLPVVDICPTPVRIPIHWTPDQQLFVVVNLRAGQGGIVEEDWKRVVLADEQHRALRELRQASLTQRMAYFNGNVTTGEVVGRRELQDSGFMNLVSEIRIPPHERPVRAPNINERKKTKFSVQAEGCITSGQVRVVGASLVLDYTDRSSNERRSSDFPVGIDQDGLPVVVTNFQGVLVRPSPEQKEILGSLIQESVDGVVKFRRLRRFLGG
jgi:hypothetical protein